LLGYTSVNPVGNSSLKSCFSGGHKLRAVIKGSVSNAPPSEPSTQTTTFIDQENLTASLLKILGCTETSKAGTNN
jgi:hypothetical protein